MEKLILALFIIAITKLNIMAQNDPIRYVALGDSYTIGEGTSPDKSWPSIIVSNLKKEGVDIELIANPSVTGWTTQDLIDKELPIFDSSKANFVTILIGVNDWVQEVSAEQFSKNFELILNHVQNRLKDPSKVLIVNIPDFSVTPDGPKYSKGRDISAGLEEFNKIISKHAKARNLQVVDLFSVSKEMKDKPELVAADNLHPSAKTYLRWEEVIFPYARDILKK
ncbi:MAG: SGNH/GDSL hydrolase family protein [Cytophagales bacterium]